MSLADGLAAMAGVAWGKSNRYRIFGYNKSFVGSAVFMIVSISLLVTYSFITKQNIQPGYILGLAFLATAVENLGVYGLDNLMIPLLIGLALSAA
jgi:phytol kinase